MDETEVKSYLESEISRNGNETKIGQKPKKKRVSRRQTISAMREVADMLGLDVVRGPVSGKYYLE